MDKPKLKELDLSGNQVQTLVKNFTFIMAARGVKLKIEDLSRSYVKQIQDMVGDLYLTLGLDVMLTS
jgi:Leucine-rich repeat (LRR) protein